MNVLNGQDAIFSYLSTEDSYLNPANSFNALLNERIATFDLQFRDQWSSITNNNTYATIKVQGDFNIYKTKTDSWNGGIIFLSDRSNEGFLKYQNVRFLASYSRRLTGRSFRNTDSHFISAGFSYGLAGTNIDYGALWFGRQYDTNLLNINPSLESGEILNTEAVNYQGLNLGFKWLYFLDEYNSYSAAIGIDHFNQPTISNDNPSVTLTPRITTQLYARLNINESMAHKPFLAVIYQKPFLQIVPGYQFATGIESLDNDLAVSMGASARLINGINGFKFDAFILAIGLSASNWKMNFSFDLTASEFKNYNNGTGAIELTLAYRILKK